MKRLKIFPLSISGYALAFLLVVASLFIGVSWYAYVSIESARSEIQQSNHAAAEKEIKIAADDLLNTLNSLTGALASWDELFQQLDQPSYYAYWHEHRLLNTDVLPDYVAQAAVYNAEGHVLAELKSSSFPVRIDPASLEPQVELNEGKTMLMLYLPIRREGTGSKLAEGYIGLRIPFLEVIKQRYRFRFLKGDTLTIKDALSGTIGLEQTINSIDFQLLSSREAEVMMSIVQSAVFQLASFIAFLCVIFYLLMVVLIGKPLLRISEYIDGLRHSAPGSQLSGFSALFPIAELEKVRNSLNLYRKELEEAQDDLDEKNQELWKLAHHDALTGVRNRRAFDHEWENSTKFLKGKRINIGLLLFDLNHFKAINDTYGHQVGDEVLIAVSESIQGALRHGEKLFRLGGDEFATLLIGNGKKDEIAVGQRCIDAVNEYNFGHMGIKESVRISCGLAHCDAEDSNCLEKLKWQADVAVYQAKKPGVVYPVLFTDDMADGTEALFSSWINDAVYNAVATGEGIAMHYQPVVSTVNGECSYHEALLRIQSKNEWIPPSNIFPLVNQKHLESELDKMVIQHVLSDLEHHLLADQQGVSINLSAETLIHPELITWLQPLTRLMSRNPIILELTETSLITQLGAATESLNHLRNMGFKVALDDFGSGYSSLRYLTAMPVDTIKFDISLIHGMTEKRLKKMIVELVKMLSELGYELVAEGIEDQELLDHVTAVGFDYAQGYLLGKPIRNVSKPKAMHF